ncbi:MAG: pyruvate kinase [Actinobacteria bacterium]|nr:pyruvate kinase [Actinomycetota bacterium]MCG2807646.1 pyruvate kinase [Coriobacteriia bacterium]
MRRTKIVATIGPATDSREMLTALVEAGIDIARLNASHSPIDALQARFELIRSIAAEAGRHVAVLLDLAGPKLRVGAMAPGSVLQAGSAFRIEGRTCLGDESHACVSYPGFASDLSAGDHILLDDGSLELKVVSTDGDRIDTTVLVGGALTSNKGVNVPGVTLGIESITDKDREVLAWGLGVGVDLIAQSFVRSADDVRELRALMGDTPIPIVAKIEKHEAIDNMEAIVAVADAVMVARGDLGVEMAPEQVPVLQVKIIQAAREAGKPVIVATQMLESMKSAPRPTRAEASDVATAIFEGADAVMLSAETAVGSYPIEAVAVTDRIVRAAEESRGGPSAAQGPDGVDVGRAVSAAVVRLAEDLELAAIVIATQSGATARAVAAHRPSVPVVAVTPLPETARRLSTVWGVVALVVPLAQDTDAMLEIVLRAVLDSGLACPGQLVAITAGRASRTPGATDFLVVREIPE